LGILIIVGSFLLFHSFIWFLGLSWVFGRENNEQISAESSCFEKQRGVLARLLGLVIIIGWFLLFHSVSSRSSWGLSFASSSSPHLFLITIIQQH